MRRFIAAACAALLACAIIAGAAFGASGSSRSKSSSKAKVSGLDREALETSMEGDLFEIRGGRLALEKTRNRAVKVLARRLIKDHTKAYGDSWKIARKLRIEVKTSPAPAEVWELKTLAKVNGRTFDRWYASLEVFDHKQDIQQTKDLIKWGSNGRVLANARQDLPMLRMHLALARKTLNKTR